VIINPIGDPTPRLSELRGELQRRQVQQVDAAGCAAELEEWIRADLPASATAEQTAEVGQSARDLRAWAALLGEVVEELAQEIQALYEHRQDAA